MCVNFCFIFLDTSSSVTIKNEIILPVNKSESNELPEIFPDSTTIGNIVPNSQLEMPENRVNMNVKDTRHFSLRPSNRRKRLCSNSSQLSTNESLTSATDERRKSNDRKKRKSKFLFRFFSCLPHYKAEHILERRRQLCGYKRE